MLTTAEIDRLFEEASKVLHMDASHDAIRGKIQQSLTNAHRAANSIEDSSSYYNTPYVRDVYGDGDSGTVVHSKSGKLTASKYKKGGDGSYALSNHKPVKQAYVSDNDADDKKESMVMLLDGQERIIQESTVEVSEVLELEESAAASGKAKVTLITAGKGSMGYYTEAALKKAEKEGIFSKGTQMFLNHQTKEERLARPEGDITKLAATLTENAKYVPPTDGKPGRLVAESNVYPEFKDFIAARKADIGVSVRVGATPSGKMQDGVPLVESIVYALSADFVTKAGRGGKIDEMYESFRGSTRSGTQPQEGDHMTDEEKQIIAKLSAAVDRLQESNNELRAANLIAESLTNSGLKPRGQDRVRKVVLASLPMKDGVLDTVKLQESVTEAITAEVAYLQESGVQPITKVVRGLGVVPVLDKDGKELSESDQLKAAEKLYEESIGDILGKEKKSA